MNENDVKKDLYKSKAMAKFSHYVSGNLYYRVELSDGVYQFPIATVDETKKYVYVNHDDLDYDIITGVELFDAAEYDETSELVIPILELSADLGQTSFETEIKGSDLNRWISKAIKNDEFIKVA
jgi:hypothetical protein